MAQEFSEQRWYSRAFRGVIGFFADVTIKPSGSFVNYGTTELRGAVSWLAGNLNLGLSALLAGNVNTGSLTIDDGNFTCMESAITASDPPTQVELVNALGSAINELWTIRIIKSTAGGRYLIFSDGTNFHYSALTVGA